MQYKYDYIHFLIWTYAACFLAVYTAAGLGITATERNEGYSSTTFKELIIQGF